MMMNIAITAAAVLAVGAAFAQQSFNVGPPLGSATDAGFQSMSANVKVFGSFNFAESCTYDAGRGLIVVPNRGAAQTEIPNDGYVSLINHDGTVHTAKWIGVNRNGLTLNNPLGSEIHNGVLYLADVDGGLKAGEPTTSVIRKFDLETGAPAGEIRTPGVPFFNDLAIAADGAIYATQTGVGGDAPDPKTWKVFKIETDVQAKELIVGAPLFQPNGIALDGKGNVVVVNIGTNDVLTFSTDGKLLQTEKAVQPGNDGIVITADGTKYVSSVRQGGISRIRPGQPADLIAQGIPNPASMCLDTGANQLVAPMNPNNAIALIPLPQ